MQLFWLQKILLELSEYLLSEFGGPAAAKSKEQARRAANASAAANVDNNNALSTDGAEQDDAETQLSLELVGRAYRLQLAMAHKHVPQSMALFLFRSIEFVLATYPGIFFGSDSAAACHDWAEAFVRYLSGFNERLRQEATCALFLLLRENQRFANQISRAGVQTTMSLSRFASSDAFAAANKSQLRQVRNDFGCYDVFVCDFRFFVSFCFFFVSFCFLFFVVVVFCFFFVLVWCLAWFILFLCDV